MLSKISSPRPYVSQWTPGIRPAHVTKGLSHANMQAVTQYSHALHGAALFFLKHLSNPWARTLAGQMAAGFVTHLHHLTKDHRRTDFNFAALDETSARELAKTTGAPAESICPRTIDGEVADVAFEYVDQQPWGSLKRFKQVRTNGEEFETPRPPLLICAPLSGHFDTLLTPTVHRLMQDFDLYITDWHDASEVPVSAGQFDLDVQIHYLKDIWLPLINERHQPTGQHSNDHHTQTVHTLGVCQPGVPLSVATALLNETGSMHAPLSMSLMGSPIDTRQSPTQVNEFAQNHSYEWFVENAVAQVAFGKPGAGQMVYPGWQQLAGFMMMNADKHMEAHQAMLLGLLFEPWNDALERSNFEHLMLGNADSARIKQAFYEEYRRTMDLPAAFYLQTIDHVFQRHLLPKGEFVYTCPLSNEKRAVDLGQIRNTAILAMEGENDDITGIGQTKAILDLTPEAHGEYMLIPKVGHYGCFSGSMWRNHTAPRMIDFIRRVNEQAGLNYHTRQETQHVLDGLELVA